MLTVIEHECFAKEAKKILTDEQYDDLIRYVSAEYTKGVVMSGTGGVQKLRYAHQTGKGKSGAARVIYLAIDKMGCVHLLEIFEKNVKENLIQSEKNTLKKLVEILKK